MWDVTKFITIETLQIIISTIVSTGLIAGILHYFYDKRIRTHDLKLKKYFELIEEMSKLVANDPDEEKMRRILNDALFFASDDVVREILKFNKLFTESRSKSVASGQNTVGISEEDLKPLIKAIRAELYLKSKSIDEEGLRFFQKVR